MNYLREYINADISDFFVKNKKKLSCLKEINLLLKQESGIDDFFAREIDLINFRAFLDQKNTNKAPENKRKEYGDFQTNITLSKQVVTYISSIRNDFEFILEPTCGKGNFILAVLNQFDSIKKIIGIEIYQPYVWITKFKILAYFTINSHKKRPNIKILHADAFLFSYKEVAKQTIDLKTLVIGNPPWITNAALSVLDATNLPKKSNFKNHTNFDAITGKGNFDIGEVIALNMLDCFSHHKGVFSFLIKNAVIKNIIEAQVNNNFRIANAKKLNIDSKKEFNVSVNASLFITKLNQTPEKKCLELDFYTNSYIRTFGWFQNKFVNSIEDYSSTSFIDGKSNFIWRSGMKHDCSKIMEFEVKDNFYKNNLNHVFFIEDKLVYGLLKSSDLKGGQINKYRKLTIVTQRKIGQKTDYIQEKYPLTYNYLNENSFFFEKRKSSVYKGKPKFSIFGIGDYSFKPYKVAISSMYKSTHFTLVVPDENGKTIMLDDTCYFISFNDFYLARIAHFLVNTELVQQFLKSIVFSDAKRSINKDILMRIDFEAIYKSMNFEYVKEKINITISQWTTFGTIVCNNQILLF